MSSQEFETIDKRFVKCNPPKYNPTNGGCAHKKFCVAFGVTYSYGSLFQPQMRGIGAGVCTAKDSPKQENGRERICFLEKKEGIIENPDVL